MKTLKFIVDGQLLKPDPECDFSGLVPGSEGYLRAEFSFSEEWKDCVKVAAFYSAMGYEYPPQKLINGQFCIIPTEALKRRDFKIQIVGANSAFKIQTNKLTVSQNGGRE